MKHEQDFSDLDALVLAEIESMGRGRHASTKRKRAARAQRRNQAVQQHDRPLSSKLSRIHGEDRVDEGISGEEAEALFDEPMVDENNHFADESEKSADSLFSAEEQAFMSRAVGFLTGRDNADMILGQVWEQLTSDHPDEFYAADATFEPAPERQTDHDPNSPTEADDAEQESPGDSA